MTQLDKETVIRYVAAIVESVNEAGNVGVPSSTVYLAFQQNGVGLDQYNQLIDLASKSGLITNQNHRLAITEKGRSLLIDIAKMKG